MTGKWRDDGDLNDRLRDLWRRRADLTAGEWDELYGITVTALRGCYRSLLDQLPASPEDYIQDFFEDKVFSLNNPGNEIAHRGALARFYKRYLLSCLRDPEVRDRTHSQEAATEEHAERSPLQKALDEKAVEEAAIEDPAAIQQLVDWVAEEVVGLIPGAGAGPAPSGAQALVSQFMGVDLGLAARSALDFLSGRGNWAHLRKDVWWIRLYLSCHFCPDDPQDRMALDTLRRAWSIPSHHYKAVLLGVSVPKQQDAAFAAFRGSLRGRWLTGLGVPVDLEHRFEMSLALKVLCLAALSLETPCHQQRSVAAARH